MYDIAIIGAGPAGATLARLIGDQYKVYAVQTGFGPAKERFRGPSTFCC
jgi:flavin-dependent dehydrogenase